MANIHNSKELQLCLPLGLGCLIINWGEPHIDGDVRPMSRGMFVYMYVCIWPRGAPYVPEKSRARTH